MDCCQAPERLTEHHFSDCMICGKKLVYHETSHSLRCSVCGKEHASNTVCESGHFVCDDCHKQDSVLRLIPFLRGTDEKDPLLLFESVIALPEIHMHGPEHHIIVPLVLLTAYRNCGGLLNYEQAMQEALRRARQVPGGSCGYWGVCGAAAGAGIYASVLLGSNPLHRDAWPFPQRLTGQILTRLAELGGPRCCKRTGRIAIECAAVFTSLCTSVSLPIEKIQCRYVSRNRECLREHCPYFPASG